jgi:hypothetical protein
MAWVEKEEKGVPTNLVTFTSHSKKIKVPNTARNLVETNLMIENEYSLETIKMSRELNHAWNPQSEKTIRHFYVRISW